MPRPMWKFLIGCVTIQIEGLCPEIFLSEIRGKYRIREIRRLRPTQMILKIPARKAEKILAAAEKRNLKWSIVGKDRQIRFAEMLTERWWIPGLVMVIMAAALWISGECLSIEIVGNETISEFALCDLLEEHGISPGMRKRKIDLLAVKNLLYGEYPALAYAEVRFDGTALCLILQEGKEIPGLLSAEPCNIVAEKRGVILSVTTGEGMAGVSPGELVEEGAPLILGAYVKKEKPFLVHARGKVLAQVDYFGRAELSLGAGLVPTGRTAEARYLLMGRMKIPLEGNNPFEYYEEEITAEAVISENMPAFLKLVKITYHECEKGVSEERRQAAEIRLREEAYYKALSQVPEDAQVKDFYSVIGESGGKLTATATVTVTEEIGREAPASPVEIPITEETGDT